MNLPNGLFPFQEECVDFLSNVVTGGKTRQVTTVKAPTGSGKTVILIGLIDRLLTYGMSDTAFLWLCPGKGNLEEQSRKKMKEFLPTARTADLPEALTSGFHADTTIFVNWELVTKTGNRALADSERKNLYDQIRRARQDGLQFIVIIDEEHANDTKRASDLLARFAPEHTIRVSATARENPLGEFYEIDELDVIDSGLITKALYINQGAESNVRLENEHRYLLKLADEKRREISAAYQELGREIRPLVIVQFPSSSTALIEAVEEELAAMGYTYENGLTAKWMSDQSEKINIEGIEKKSASPAFLLMKQAIATGWDCPRAKVLVKLRENMNEDFEIQTIGRIRRMPEAKHYGIDVLDFCYLYTFDEKYKESIRQNIGQAFETRRLILKEKCEEFSLEKQFRDRDNGGLGERETLALVHEFLTEKYKLTGDPGSNQLRLENAGYRFGEELFGQARQGKFVTSTSLLSEESGDHIVTRMAVDTHRNGIELMHAIDLIKSAIGMQAQKTRAVLERMFRDSNRGSKKLLRLNSKEFYAFVINNAKLLREEFLEATAKLAPKYAISSAPKTGRFTLPQEEFFRYDPDETEVEELASSAYQGYSTAILVEGIRSKSERLFERYCEQRDDIDWVYKNGDTGRQYLSVVYYDGLGKQWLFYPDYIVRKKNGEIWIIETKGGESQKGKSKNIDRQTANKFQAFRCYAEEHGIKWGFVRDKNEMLRINNTVYSEDLRDEHWVALSKMF